MIQKRPMLTLVLHLRQVVLHLRQGG